MAEAPYMRLWTDAYLADTHHLSTEEHGAYLLMLMAAWRSPTSTLDDDDKFLSRVVHASPRVWARLRPVMLKFWSIVDGQWQQKRLMREKSLVNAVSEKRSTAAHTKHRKNNKTTPAHAGANGMQNAPNLYPYPDKKEEDPPIPPSDPQPSLLPPAEASVDPKPAKRSAKVEYPEAFERLWRTYPLRDEDRASKRDIFRSWRTVTQSNDPESLISSAERWHAEQHDNDCRFGLRGWLSKGRYLQPPPLRRTQAMLGPRYETSGDVAVRVARELMHPQKPTTVIPFPYANGAFDDQDDEREILEGARDCVPDQAAPRLQAPLERRGRDEAGAGRLHRRVAEL